MRIFALVFLYVVIDLGGFESRRGSVVEHILGKDGVVSPILTGGTIFVTSCPSLECSMHAVCYTGKKVEGKEKPLSKSKKFCVGRSISV